MIKMDLFSSFIYSVRSEGKQFRTVIEVTWKTDNRRLSSSNIVLFGDERTPTSHRDGHYTRNEYLKQALFIYCFTPMPKNGCNIEVKVTWHLNNSGWFSSNTFVFGRKHIKLVFWSKSHDKWKIYLRSLQLFLRFEGKTHSSYGGQRHRSKRRC